MYTSYEVYKLYKYISYMNITHMSEVAFISLEVKTNIFFHELQREESILKVLSDMAKYR